jgi:hypothetical protein
MAPRALWLFGTGLMGFFDRNLPQRYLGPGKHKAMKHKRNG